MPFKLVLFDDCDVVLSSVLLLCDQDKFKFLSVPLKKTTQKNSPSVVIWPKRTPKPRKKSTTR